MSDSEANAQRQPKLFISYSWTSAAHVEWVMRLGVDLRAHGVDAIIDQWDLKEGQDAHSFMEQMVRDQKIEKVAMICDDKYVDRANNRTGGVGVESQIITKEIYRDVEQTKFVAVALSSETDGSANLPNFLKNRIYLDFRDADKYAENFEKLLRWIFDKQLYVKPEIGERPRFIDEQVHINPTSLRPSGKVAIVSGENAVPFVSFWRDATKRHTDFTLDLSNENDSDQIVFDTIMAMPPLISEIIVNIRDELDQGTFRNEYLDQIRIFFEACLENYKNGPTNWSADATKFFTEFVFVSTVVLLIRYKNFSVLDKLLAEPFLQMLYGSITAKSIPFSEINTHLASFEHRNKRLNLNRASLRADVIRDVCSQVPIKFWEYLQADFFLFLYCERRGGAGVWWPDSNIYAVDGSGAYPLFVRAQTPSVRDRVLPLLDLETKQKLESFAAELRTERYSRYRWRSSFSTLGIGSLMNIEALLASYPNGASGA